MAWTTSSALEEKIRFVMEYERDEATMREVCARFTVSRETGYVWLQQPREAVAGLLMDPGRGAALPTTRAEVERAVLRAGRAPRALGAAEAEADSGARPAWAEVAGDEHDRRDSEASGARY